MKRIHTGGMILLLNALLISTTVLSSPKANIKENKDLQKFEKTYSLSRNDNGGISRMV